MEQINTVYGAYRITTDKSQMRINDVFTWLSERSYWCSQIPYPTFKTAFDNSFCIGTLYKDQQVAFGRMVTDYATFAYLADVYVIGRTQR